MQSNSRASMFGMEVLAVLHYPMKHHSNSKPKPNENLYFYLIIHLVLELVVGRGKDQA